MKLDRKPDHVQLPSGEWIGGHPQAALKKLRLPADHPHTVDVDVSTGRINYFRLSDAEIADHRAMQAKMRAETENLVKNEDPDLALIRKEAATNPAYAALVRFLGVKT